MTIRLVKKITCILTVAGTATPVNNVLAASATTYYAQTGPQILADGGPANNMHQHLAVQPQQHQHYNGASSDPQLYTQLCPDQNNQSNNYICGPRWRCKTAVVGGIIAACTVPFWKHLNQKLFPSIFSPASTTSTSTTLYPGGGTYVDPSGLPVYTNNPFPQTGSSSWTTTSGGPLAPTPFVNTWTVTTSLAPEVEPPKVGQESTSTTTSTVLEVVPPSSSSPDNGHTGDIKKCDLLTSNDLDKRVLFEPARDKLLLHVADIYQGQAARTLATYDVGNREYVIVLKSSILFDVISGAKDIVEAVNHAELPPSATSSSTSKANNFLAQIAPNYHPPKAGLSAALKRFNSGGQWVVVKDLFCNDRILGEAAGVSDYQLQRYACHSLPELSREVMERLVVATKDEHEDASSSAEISTRQVKEMRDFVRRVAQMIVNVAMHFNYIQERIEETSRVAFVNAEWRYFFPYNPATFDIIPGRKNDQLRLAPYRRGATISTIELEQQNKRSPVYVDANTIEQIKQLGCNIKNIDSPPLAQVASNKKELSFAGECNCSEDSRRYCNSDTIFDSHTDPSGCRSFCCS